jgi:DNA-dependent RNA polymerase auxiliary subunit epsilon
MKKFEVWIPEKRVEVVKVLYTIEAESEEQVRDLMKEYEFMDKAEFVETRESQWGVDVDDVHYDDAEIKEVTE